MVGGSTLDMWDKRMSVLRLTRNPVVLLTGVLLIAGSVSAHDRFARHKWFGDRWPGFAFGDTFRGPLGWPNCVSRELVVVDQFIGVPYAEPYVVVPEPVFVPVPVPAQPMAALPARGNRLAIDDVENFARKNLDRNVQDIDAFRGADEIRRRARVLKTSTPESRDRADRMISFGDQSFAKQNFARATAYYRKAIAQAPDYPESHFRLAHAYVATRQFNLALKAALVALELARTGSRDGFSLEDMYQGDQFVRQQHLNRLVDASLREPEDGGLQFLIGFTLQYDRQQDKARERFLAAQKLAGPQQGYASYFLPVPKVAEPQ